MPKATVIIVNYNGKGLISDCLKALEDQRFKDFEVVIIDNGSSDDSLHEIQSYLKSSNIASRLKLVTLDRNLGFAGGNQEGLKYAESNYIALLNNDTKPEPGWLSELVETMDNNPQIGICASKLVVYGTDIIDSAGDGFSTFLKGYKRGENENASLYSRHEYVFGACAGAALYRSKMIKDIGLMDEDFFLIHEDTDLNFRAQLSGWKVLYIPTAVVFHKVRSSIGHMSDTAVYYSIRNSELVRIKNVPIGFFLRCLPELVTGMMTEFLYFVVKNGKLKIYIKAKTDALRMFPSMLKKRKAVMKHKKVTNRYLKSIMTPVWQWSYLISKIRKLIHG